MYVVTELENNIYQKNNSREPHILSGLFTSTSTSSILIKPMIDWNSPESEHPPLSPPINKINSGMLFLLTLSSGQPQN